MSLFSDTQTKAQALAALNTVIIIGEIRMLGHATPGTGWLLCNGAAVSRATYVDLFTKLGTSYGAGNTTTTFNVPDLRGNVPAGAGANGVTALGTHLGESTHVLTVSELPSATLSSTDTDLIHGTTGGSGAANGGDVAAMALGATASAATTQLGGSDTPHNNMQPTLGVNFYIYAGI